MAAEPQGYRQWESVKSVLRTEVGDATFSSWIALLRVDKVEEGVVTLGAPTPFVRDRVRNSFGDKIRAAWRQTDPKIERVEYHVRDRVPVGDAAASARALASQATVGAPVNAAASVTNAAFSTSPEPASRERINRAPASARSEAEAQRLVELSNLALNRRSTFDSFVVGRPNEFAYAAARRVAEDPTAPFNPLFIYGAPGHGKTHLMQAIAHRRQELFPHERYLYLSSETFLNEFMNALRHNTVQTFKEIFRSVDMLLIDDVQLIIGKNRTQEEFFHTFNALADKHRQIVLSADRSPLNLEGLDERLRSRLSWGLVADIHAPDYELRLGILEKKTEAALESTPTLKIDSKVLDFLAHRISTDVRTLEGALNRLFAKATLLNRPATIELAQRELSDLLRATDRKVAIDEIQRTVAEHFSIRLADMSSPRRSRSVARPRQVAMYLSKQLTSKSLPEIGQKFGGRDHTTVMHAVKRITELRSTDASFDEDVERLRQKLESV
ncbi:MAG: chromosomal replication initiator protein DnaA [Pseudomonadota bacterium]